MNTKTTLSLVGIAVLALFAWTLWYSWNATQAPEPAAEGEIVEEIGFVPQRITAQHQYRAGMHTVAGEVDLPTPCYLLETNAVVRVEEPDPDEAIIQFSTVDQSEICAQVITPVRFKESFAASEDATITATWNGTEVPINVIEVGPDENLDDFELFIKG
jgi:hypothetical protein